MNLTPTDYEKNLVREACRDIINDPKRGDIAHTKDLMEFESINTYFGSKYKNSGANAAIGVILSDADYTEMWVKSKYIIDANEV